MTSKKDELPRCGIIMPISGMGEYTESHWRDVLQIISDGVKLAGYEARMVSDDDAVNIIQKNIVRNIQGDEVIVCDISGLNPNVMFELGLRLAFDKPTIIISDGTNPPFDTNIIEYIQYPKGLRHAEIELFKKKLADKITATLAQASSDDNYSPFIKHFGDFTPVGIGKIETSEFEYLNNAVVKVSADIKRLYNLVSEQSKRNERFNDTSSTRYFDNFNLQKKEIELSNLERQLQKELRKRDALEKKLTLLKESEKI